MGIYCRAPTKGHKLLERRQKPKSSGGATRCSFSSAECHTCAPSALALAKSAAATAALPGDGSAAKSKPFAAPSASTSGVAPRLVGGDGPPAAARGRPEMCSTSSRCPRSVRRHTKASMSQTLPSGAYCEMKLPADATTSLCIVARRYNPLHVWAFVTCLASPRAQASNMEVTHVIRAGTTVEIYSMCKSLHHAPDHVITAAAE